MRIVVAGLGYVGLTNAVLLAQNNKVIAVDIDAARVDLVNARQSPIAYPELEEFLKHEVFSSAGPVMRAARLFVPGEVVSSARPFTHAAKSSVPVMSKNEAASAKD